MIGDIVKVIVDRPLGSQHPQYKETYYPINYGFVEGIMEEDEEEQDSYIPFSLCNSRPDTDLLSP